MWPLWPGQSFDHLAMKVAIMPRRCARTLVKVLNSARAVGGLERLAVLDRRFEHAGPGLGVQALERECACSSHSFSSCVIELGVHRAERSTE